MITKPHISMKPERLRNQKHLPLNHTSSFLSLSASADCHKHSCYLGCVGHCNGPCYLRSLSPFVWPVLSLVLSGRKKKKTSLLPHSARWWLLQRRGPCGGRLGTSCGPRDGCTVFLGLHAQRSYAGGFAVWINIEIIAIDSTSHCRTTKKAAHMRLSHVAAAWTGHAQEVSYASRTVRVRRHARGDGVTRHNTTGHRWCSTAAPDPCRVLDLREKARIDIYIMSLYDHANVTILTKGSCEGPTEKLSLESAAPLSLMALYSEVQFCVYCSFTALVHTVFPFCFWPKKKKKKI